MGLILFPAGAWACESTPAASGACASGHGCGPAAVALMAAVAALGVWVLRLIEKDNGPVKRAGQAVGWVLVVGGLLGFFCAAVSHAAKSRSRSCHMTSGASDVKLPPGHPPLSPSGK